MVLYIRTSTHWSLRMHWQFMTITVWNNVIWEVRTVHTYIRETVCTFVTTSGGGRLVWLTSLCITCCSQNVWLVELVFPSCLCKLLQCTTTPNHVVSYNSNSSYARHYSQSSCLVWNCSNLAHNFQIHNVICILMTTHTQQLRYVHQITYKIQLSNQTMSYKYMLTYTNWYSN